MITVTSGAGFIGRCVACTLNDVVRNDIIIVDNINETDKWMYMRNKQLIMCFHKLECMEELTSYENVESIIHMGARSSTMGTEPSIVYVDMSEKLRGKDQYYTQANMDYLRNVGYDQPFSCVEEDVKDYVRSYLNKDFLNY